MTRLSVTATPGPTRSFSPKTAAPVDAEQITELSVTATAGGLHSFDPKTPDVGGGGKPSDRITDLNVWATPGGLREFEAKTAAIIDEIVEQQ